LLITILGILTVLALTLTFAWMNFLATPYLLLSTNLKRTPKVKFHIITFLLIKKIEKVSHNY